MEYTPNDLMELKRKDLENLNALIALKKIGLLKVIYGKNVNKGIRIAIDKLKLIYRP